MGLSISQPDRGHFHPRPLCSSEQKQPLGDTVLALLDEVQCVGVWYIWEHLWPRHLTERVLRWDTLIGAGLIHCREQIPTDCGPRILLRSRPGVLWALDACQLLLLHIQTPLFVMTVDINHLWYLGFGNERIVRLFHMAFLSSFSSLQRTWWGIFLFVLYKSRLSKQAMLRLCCR